jgi:UDP-GlcNAc:undecaprenyl-phosphate GlcNAc-1-phosphate transferase
MTWIILGSIAVSLVLSLLATPVSQRLAARFGMLDRPAHHKKHAGPVPLLGGSAVLVAVLIPALGAVAVASEWAVRGVPDWAPELVKLHVGGAAARAPQAIGILLGALGLHVMGIIDDRRPLGPWTKLAVQVLVAAGVVVFCDVRILTVAGPAGSIAASILWLVVITNSFNFLDNMDGLATGVSAICCMALLGAALETGQLFVAGLAGCTLGALLGFLPTNYPPAKQFLGDGGSLVIGYLLGVLSCLTTYVRPGETFYAYGVFVPLVLLAVPLYDTASVMYLRIREGRNPMVGDRRHFSHRLLKRGMGVRTALLTIYLCTAATAVGATLLPQVDTAGAVLIFCQTAAVVSIIGLLESAGQKT